MGVSGQLYHLPLPSGEPAVTDVDLRDGPAIDMRNSSATTSAGRVVGDGITELLNEVVLRGLRLIAACGSPILFSWVSIVEDLKGPTTLKKRYGNFRETMIFLDLHAHRRTCSHLINETVTTPKAKEYRLTHVVQSRLRSSETFIHPRYEGPIAPVMFQI